MQMQGEIGILARVLRGCLNRHLLKADARGPFAGDIVVAQALAAQVPLGQRIQIMRFMRLKHIGFKQGVMGNTAQKNANP